MCAAESDEKNLVQLLLKRLKQRRADHKDQNKKIAVKWHLKGTKEPRLLTKGSLNKRSHNSKPYQENHASFYGYQPEMKQNRDIGQVVHRVPCFPATVFKCVQKLDAPNCDINRVSSFSPIHIFMVNPQFSNKSA